MNTANALGWWWVYNLQQETTNAMRNASYDYLDDLYGISQPPSRQQHCLDITNGNLGFALSREYVDKFVPDSVKPEVTNNSITTTTSVISINYKQLHTMHVLLLLYYLLLLWLLHYTYTNTAECDFGMLNDIQTHILMVKQLTLKPTIIAFWCFFEPKIFNGQWVVTVLFWAF